MANILDYIAWRGDLDFSEAPFCEVDNLVLSLLSYFDFSGLVPESPQKSVTLSQAAGQYFRLRPWTKNSLGVLFSDQYRELLEKAAGCRRFGSILPWGQVNRIDEDLEMQFSATCFSLGSGETFVAFRGTDDTIVGWKEDFNMTVLFPIPAQQQAALYLDRTSRETGDRLILGGHSKGGNLAVYAAAFCSLALQNRIGRIYSHDGPGFLPAVLESEGFSRIRSRIDKTLPQSSVIGMLLEQQERYQVVQSRSVSLLQHDPFTWRVKEGAFVPVSRLSSEARYVDSTLSAWLEKMSVEERERIVDTLFQIFSTNDITDFEQLVTDWQKNLPAVAKTAIRLDSDSREFLSRALKELAVLSVKKAPQLFRRR